MAIVTQTNLQPAVERYFSNLLLSTPEANMIHGVAAQKKFMPRNAGTKFVQRRYNNLQTATVPLGVDGIEPPPQLITAVNIEAKLELYGTWLQVNELVTLQNNDDALNAITRRLGYCLRETEDELTRNMLKATASAVNCVGGNNGKNPTEIAESDIDEATQALIGNDAMMMLSNVEGQDRFGTAPVYAAFLGMAHTDLIRSFQNLTRFKNKYDYPDPSKALPSEWGSINNLRVLVSSKGIIEEGAASDGSDVYDIPITGTEAYSRVEQDGLSSQWIYNAPELNGPLRLNSTVGFKFMTANLIEQDLWILKLRATLPV